MIGFVKRVIRKVFVLLGYQISRIHEPVQPPAESPALPAVSYENFKNLSRAYELLLNRLTEGVTIAPNEVRPALLGRLTGTPPAEAYFIVQALIKTRSLEGDVCEFGVAQGETSALIANELTLHSPSKILHLFDSFEGLSRPTEKDELIHDMFALGSMEAYAGTMAYAVDSVKSRLNAISIAPDRYKIHPGFIEDVLRTDKALPERVSFAYVDFDLYEPIRVALEFLHQRTGCGAAVIVDDYGYFSAGARTAVDEFVASHNMAQKVYDCFVPETDFGYCAVLTRLSD